jgi:7-cyano-7-deazaguanine synthase
LSNQAALVLFSGGQDSTACLAWACERFQHVETVGFSYGQRHIIEMQARKRVLAEVKAAFPRWAGRLEADHELALPTLAAISESSLTRDVAFAMTASGLPNTFVPGRNLLFFTYAAALGYRRGLHTLVGGMCETDFSGYPDCRDATLQALAQALRLGTEAPFAIVTPLMWLTKAATWALTEKLGGEALVEIVREHTHTCYTGERGARHAWGYGCTTCPACVLRAKGWEEWRAGRTGGSAARPS